MNKDLRRILELSGVAEKSGFVNRLYENYSTSGETLRGFDGPFKMPNGRTVYYDLKEHKYYDGKVGIHLNENETNALYETNGYNPTVVLHARRGDETIDLRLEAVTEMKPMMSMLRNNGYDDFEMSDGEDRVPVNPDDMNSELGDDHPDGEMVRRQMDTMKDNIERLCAMVDDGTELPAWVQSKITMANDYLDTATDYLDSESPVDPDNANGMDDEMGGMSMDEPTNLGGGTMKTEGKVDERKLSKGEKKDLENLKDKYDNSAMKKSMKKQYGKDWKDVYYGMLTKKAKNESYDESEEMRDLVYGLLRSVYGGTLSREDARQKISRFTESEEAVDKLFEKFDKAVEEARKYADKYEDSWRAFQEETAHLNYLLEGIVADFVKNDYMDYTTRSMRSGEKGQMDVQEDKKKDDKKVEDDPCWKGYEMVGTKKKNGKEVPNCVPKEEGKENFDTDKKFSKGQKVMYKDKEATVRVPDAQADFVVITVDGTDKKVRASELATDIVKEGQETYSGWKKAVKKKHGSDVEFEGDKDICQAFVNKNGKRTGVGEWDGDKGELHEAAVDATVFGGDQPYDAVDDQQQQDERTGRADRTGTKVKVPKEVMSSIDKRIKEIKKSIERYDNKGYNEKSVKDNAIECLEQIKTNLGRGDHEGFMEAQIFYGTLMSPITNMFPAQLINFLATGANDE